MQQDGTVLIDKPAGMSSFGVVARIRRVLRQRGGGAKIKVGHTGTLDPFATGLMILVVGSECRNAMHYTKLDKVYEATIVLGSESTTGDPEGDVRQVSTAVPSREDVARCLRRFTGEIRQRPPIFSAIKINGQRAYKLAREGKEIDIPERTVLIYAIDTISYTYPELRLRVHVSSGTYIRSLAVDIGASLATGAYCRELRRTQIGSWSIDQAKSLSAYGITS
jgi:tRNA pseudouridine55 synthase